MRCYDLRPRRYGLALTGQIGLGVDTSELEEQLRIELQALARDEGLTPSKLEGSRLLSSFTLSGELSVQGASEALLGLIVDLVGRLRDEKERQAARATMNLVGSNSRGSGAQARQEALAIERGVDKRTVRRWWTNSVATLAKTLVVRIGELNEHPSGWEPYIVSQASGRDSAVEPGYSFERVDSAWRLRDRVAIEMITYRWLTARRDGLDRVRATAWYFSDQSEGSCEIVPLLNCVRASDEHLGRGLHVAELEFPKPLKAGEEVFFAYKILIHSNQVMEPVFYHGTQSAGVKLLNCRVQFDPAAVPEAIWSFATPHEADQYISPPAGSPKYLFPNRLAYTEHSFRNCQYGVRYGIAWQWETKK